VIRDDAERWRSRFCYMSMSTPLPSGRKEKPEKLTP
jgi:hypothetical protein